VEAPARSRRDRDEIESPARIDPRAAGKRPLLRDRCSDQTYAEDVCGLILLTRAGRGEGGRSAPVAAAVSAGYTYTAVAGEDPVHSPSARRLVDKCLEHPLGTSPPLGSGSPSSLNSHHRATLGRALRNVNPQERLTLVRHAESIQLRDDGHRRLPVCKLLPPLLPPLFNITPD